MSTDHTDFGFTQVPRQEKQARVKAIFDSVAPQYDLMNDLMSLGLHRLWKRQAIQSLHILPHHHVLDVAAGSGDLSLLIADKISDKGHLTISDINASMLDKAKIRFLDKGIIQNVEFVLANAEELPFNDNQFDRIIIGFGLRNVTDKLKALESFYRVLKPGGKLVVLEFSQVSEPILSKLYNTYSFKVLPRLGKFILNDAQSYQYLVESIRMHPNQEALKAFILEAKFDTSSYQNLFNGIVAIHQGVKY